MYRQLGDVPVGGFDSKNLTLGQSISFNFVNGIYLTTFSAYQIIKTHHTSKYDRNLPFYRWFYPLNSRFWRKNFQNITNVILLFNFCAHSSVSLEVIQFSAYLDYFRIFLGRAWEVKTAKYSKTQGYLAHV